MNSGEGNSSENSSRLSKLISESIKLPIMSLNNNNNITKKSSSSSKIDTNDKKNEIFINDDGGDIDVHIIRKLIYQKYQENTFEGKNIYKILSFNLVEGIHFTKNSNEIFFNSMSKSTKNDLKFLLTIIQLMGHQSILKLTRSSTNKPTIVIENKTESLKVLIETLLNKDCNTVIGYRFWCFFLTTKPLIDNNIKELEINLLKNLKTSFDEVIYKSRLLQKDNNNQLKKKNIISENNEIKKKVFQYTEITDERLLFNIIKDYLIYDKNYKIKQQSHEILFQKKNKEQNKDHFYDDFLNENICIQSNEYEDLDYSKIQNIKLLSKESSMIYHTQDVNSIQKDIKNYFHTENSSFNKIPDINLLINILDDKELEQQQQPIINNDNDDDDDDDNINRLNNLRKQNINDSLFKKFPYLNLVYSIPNQFLFPEIFYFLPLPHTIGSILSYKLIYDNTKNAMIDKRYKNTKIPLNNNIKNNLIGLYDSNYFPETRDIMILLNSLDGQKKIKEMNDYCDEIFRKKRNPLSAKLKIYKVLSHDIIKDRQENLKSSFADWIHGETKQQKLNFPIFLIKYHKFVNNKKPSIILYNRIIEKENEKFMEIEEENHDTDNEDDTDKEELDTKQKFFDYCKLKPPITILNNENNFWWKELLDTLTNDNISVLTNIDELIKLNNNTIPKSFIEQDIYLQLNILNRHRYENLQKKFPNYKNKKHKDFKLYNERFRQVLDAMVAEVMFWFLNCPKESTSPALFHMSDWFKSNSNNFVLRPINRDINLRPYSQFRLWIQGFFQGIGNVIQNYHIMAAVYFAKFHHVRYFVLNDLDIQNRAKNNILLTGSGFSGKTFILQIACKSIPADTETVYAPSHTTTGAFNVHENHDAGIRFHDEFSSKFFMLNTDKNGNSNGSTDEANSQLKHILTSHQTQTLAQAPREKGDIKRKLEISRASCQTVLLCATNNPITGADQNLLSRFLVLSVPKGKKQIGSDAKQISDENPDPNMTCEISDKVGLREHHIIHTVYTLMELIFKSYATGEDKYGVEISGGFSSITSILNILTQQTCISTSHIRKRDHIQEMSRTMALSYASFTGMTADFTQYLFSHNDKRIGFNHRILSMGVLPFCVITKDQVIDSLKMLSTIFIPSYLDEILKIIAFDICHLDDLEETEFYIDDDKQINYNYIAIKKDIEFQVASLISNYLNEMTLSESDIFSLLKELSKSYLPLYIYFKTSDCINEDEVIKDKNIQRKYSQPYLDIKYDRQGKPLISQSQPIICFPKNKEKKCIVTVSVQYLKQKFPNRLNDNLIKSIEKKSQNNNNNNNDDNDNNNNDDDKDDNESNFFNNDNGDDNSKFIKPHNYNQSIKNCFDYKKNEEPFVNAIKEFYDNKFLEDIGLDKDEENNLYKEYNINGIDILRRFLIPVQPKDYIIKNLPHELPIDSTNIVKFPTILSTIHLERNNNPGRLIKNPKDLLPSVYLNYRAPKIIHHSNNECTVIEMDGDKIFRNLNTSSQQNCDHDYSPCYLHLENIKFPGFMTLENNFLINHPVMTFHHLKIWDHKKNPNNQKLLYPELDMKFLIEKKWSILHNSVNYLSSTNNIPKSSSIRIGIDDISIKKHQKLIFSTNNNIDNHIYNNLYPHQHIIQNIQYIPKDIQNIMDQKKDKFNAKAFLKHAQSQKRSELNKKRRNSKDDDLVSNPNKKQKIMNKDDVNIILL